ncbi:hypothetical protein K443DRAFT_112119, partial [Laccaria amethystina LaAM-08-1]
SFLCGFKGQKRQEARVAAFQRYFAFSVWWASTLRAKRDEKRALPRSKDILHFLFGGQNEGTKETRGARYRVPEILCIFCLVGR